MHRASFFEINVADPEAGIAFYGGLFGWTITQLDDQPYWLINDGSGTCGAIMARRGPSPEFGTPMQGATLIMESDDIAADYEKAENLGAKGLIPERNIPGFGRAAYLSDPDGNFFGLINRTRSAN